MRTRKFLSLALVLVLCVGLLAVPALADDDEGKDEFVIQNGVLVDFKDNGEITRDVVIPWGVTMIGENAFAYKTGLISVSIPNSVTTIGEHAFSNCYKLTSVFLPEGLTTISTMAFRQCTNLREISFPSTVTSIESTAFSQCSSLTSVTIPEGMTTVSYSAFENCTSLTTVNLPQSLTTIEGSAFAGCSSLTGLVIPPNVTTISGGAFKNCTSLTSVVIPSGVTFLRSAFQGCSSLTDISIPHGFITIGGSTFKDCTSLQSITLPSTVQTILFRAFEGCTSLTSVTIPASVTSMYEDAFAGCPGVTIHGAAGSYAEGYAKQLNIPFVADQPAVLPTSTTTTVTTITTPTAQPSTQTVTVDGKPVQFAMYALNGGSVNYIRVRDLAALLNGTAAQFEVGWNGNVTLTAKTPYTGAKDEAPFNTEMSYTVYNQPTYVNGQAVNLDAIQITYNGGGYTYYKLRDLAQALGFNVGWSADKGVFVETDKPYSDKD